MTTVVSAGTPTLVASFAGAASAEDGGLKASAPLSSLTANGQGLLTAAKTRVLSHVRRTHRISRGSACKTIPTPWLAESFHLRLPAT